MSGSYAYVVSDGSDSLAIVDVSNKAAPTLIGSLIDSTVMNGVRCSAHATQRPPCLAICALLGLALMVGHMGLAARSHAAAAWWARLSLAAASLPHAASAYLCVLPWFTAAMAHLWVRTLWVRRCLCVLHDVCVRMARAGVCCVDCPGRWQWMWVWQMRRPTCVFALSLLPVCRHVMSR